LRSSFIKLNGNNEIQNIEVISETAGLNGALIEAVGSNILVEGCLLRFGEAITTTSSNVGVNILSTASRDIRVVNNKIDNVFSGVVSTFGANNLHISDNEITNVSGTGDTNTPSVAIKLGTDSRSSNLMVIHNNDIDLNATSNTDLRGIMFDVDNSVETLKITKNTITGALNGLGKNYISNGIRVVNEGATGNTIEHAFVSENYIKNIKLDDLSVFGMYFGDIDNLNINNNILINCCVYDANFSSSPPAFIWLESNINMAEIINNELKTGEAFRGISVNNTSTIANISNNIIQEIGNADATYIYGLSHRANINGNTLVGPADIGIWWKGSKSKMHGNHLSTVDPTTDYAFKNGIKVQGSYSDVENNTIVDMVDEDSIGILNTSTAVEGLKIVGNKVDGDKMAQMVALVGNNHIVSGNHFNNTSVSSTKTRYITLGENADGVVVACNLFEGKAHSAVYSAYTVTNITISGNTLILSSIVDNVFWFADTSVANCFVVNNKLPPSLTSSQMEIIGVTPALGTYNNNVVNSNFGLIEYYGMHAASGVSGHSATGDGYQLNWVMTKVKHGYPSTYEELTQWEPNTLVTDNPRILYFPLDRVPNGAKLLEILVHGRLGNTSSGYFVFRVFKHSKTTAESLTGSGYLDASLISDEPTITTSGNFGTSWVGTGLITITAAQQTINHLESSYYLEVEHVGSSPASDVHIYGATAKFRL
jgi:hypothetical protein